GSDPSATGATVATSSSESGRSTITTIPPSSPAYHCSLCARVGPSGVGTTKSVQRSIGVGASDAAIVTPAGGGTDSSSTAYSSSNALKANTAMNRSPLPSARPSRWATSHGTASVAAARYGASN